MPEEPEEERKYYTLKPKSFERVNLPRNEQPEGVIDVRSMLNQNLAQPRVNADPAAPILTPVSAGARRRKDFWTTIAIAAVFFGVPAFFFRETELVLIGLLSGFALFTGVVAWIFWGIMDRY